ncbi:MAG: outer membrane protein assembly factor BamB [Shewanellaceae bacterium]|nr:outer membrane protein assembly factor BamB [Shewanellaceae bacterium]
MRMNILKVAALLYLIGLTGCASNKKLIDEQPTPLQPLTAFQVKTSVKFTHQIHTTDAENTQTLVPAQGYQKYFIAERNQGVFAFDATTNNKLWQAQLTDTGHDADNMRFSSGLTVGLNQVYLGSESGALYALDEQTGAQNWRIHLNGELLSPPLLISHYLIVHAGNGTIHAIDAITGQPLWQYQSRLMPLSLRGTSTPASEFGAVFVGTADGKIVILSLKTGLPYLSKQLQLPNGSNDLDRIIDIDSQPIIVDNTLYTLGYQGHLTALDFQKNQIIWQQKYSGYHNFTHHHNTLFITDEYDNVIGIDRENGHEIWRNQALKRRQLTTPLLYENLLIVGDYEGYVHFIDISTGIIVGRAHPSDTALVGEPIRIDNDILLQSQNNTLYRLTIEEKAS